MVKKTTTETIKPLVQVMIDQESANKADKIQQSDSLTFKNRKHVVELAINEFYKKRQIK